MLEIFSLLCLLTALSICAALLIIDLRTLLLPNILVLGLGIAGAVFHIASLFYYDAPLDLIMGGFIGGGVLLLIREGGNRFYKTDTLGLGDVKLMFAGGLWLGTHFIMPALVVGALAGLLHGGLLIIKQRIRTGEFGSLSTFSLPAGPGFIIGLVIVALAKFWGLPHLFF